MTPHDASADVLASQGRWLIERRYLDDNRFRLSQLAAQLHAGIPSVRGLLTTDGWIPAEPVPLGEVQLRWSPGVDPAPIQGTETETVPVRPIAADGRPFPTYAAALGALAPPALFEDRPCYRLTELVDAGGAPRLTFGRATFFDIVNICEAAAHELARAEIALGRPPQLDDLRWRQFVGDPCDLGRRPVVPAISTLTIRRSRRDGPTMILHHRDPAKVAHAGGLFQVMPVGVFQPSSATPGDEDNDFDLWRSIVREYSEELLGNPEVTGDGGPIDYDAWPFFQDLREARRTGGLDVYWLGFGVDPLSLVADLLVVAVFDDDVFDDLFERLVSTNAEGRTVGSTGDTDGGPAGIPLTGDAVERYAGREPLQAAGAALLDLAWRHRDLIL